MPIEPLPARRPEILAARAGVAMTLRSSLANRGYLEIDTPVIEPATYGADDPTFRTWSGAFGALRLRPVAEPYLKLLVAGGMAQVFDLARSFRDEPADSTHNIEYTLLEAYKAHADWNDMRALAAELIQHTAEAVNGTTTILDAHGRRLDLGSPWPTLPIQTAISQAVSEDVSLATPLRDLVRIAQAHGVDVDDRWSADQVTQALYEHLVEPVTTGPVVYTGFPASLAPQARRQDGAPRRAEQWDLVILGREIATGATEITDVDDQTRRFGRRHDGQIRPVHPLFRQALDAGMPPCGGLAIGFERLVMTLVGATALRDVIPFPTPINDPSDDPAASPG